MRCSFITVDIKVKHLTENNMMQLLNHVPFKIYFFLVKGTQELYAEICDEKRD